MEARRVKPESADLRMVIITDDPPADRAELSDLLMVSKYLLDIEITVRCKRRGTSQSAWPSVSGLARRASNVRSACRTLQRSNLCKTARRGDSGRRGSEASPRGLCACRAKLHTLVR